MSGSITYYFMALPTADRTNLAHRPTSRAAGVRCTPSRFSIRSCFCCLHNALWMLMTCRPCLSAHLVIRMFTVLTWARRCWAPRGGALVTNTSAPGHFSSMTSLIRAKASVIGCVAGRRLSTSHVPRKSTMLLKLPTTPLSLLGTSSKVAPGQQATLSVSRAGNSRVCESPTISVLVGWSGSRLAPWLVPGVATLYKHMKCMVIMLHLYCHCLASALVLV